MVFMQTSHVDICPRSFLPNKLILSKAPGSNPKCQFWQPPTTPTCWPPLSSTCWFQDLCFLCHSTMSMSHSEVSTLSCGSLSISFACPSTTGRKRSRSSSKGLWRTCMYSIPIRTFDQYAWRTSRALAQFWLSETFFLVSTSGGLI